MTQPAVGTPREPGRHHAQLLAGRVDAHPQWVAMTPASTKRSAVIVAVVVALLILALWMFRALSSFLFILLIAWLLSIAMEPMVLMQTRRGIKRGVASALTLLFLVLIVIGVGALFGQLFLAQIDALQKALPGAVTSGLEWVNSTFKTKINAGSVAGSLNLTPSKIASLVQNYGGGLLGVFGSVLAFLFDALTILVFAYYLSADSISLRQTIGSFLPPRYQPVLVTVWTIAVEKTGGFVVSKAILAVVSAIAHGAFFWFIDVPFWLPLGVVVGIVGQFIPTIGTYIGVLLPCLFALANSPVSALWILIFATVYQQVENYILTPRISRRTMDVHPAIALAAVFVGAALFGPVGAIIGIPVAAAVITIIETFRRRHELLPELADLQDEELADDEDEEEEEGGGVTDERSTVRRAADVAAHITTPEARPTASRTTEARS